MQSSLVILFSSLAGVSFGLYSFFRRWQQQRILLDTPEARMRSAAQGYVKLSGRARPLSGKALRAPLSGRSCVWWKYTVRTRAWGPATHWRIGDWGSSDEPFLLTELADHCLVDPQGAEIEPSDRRVWFGESPGTPTLLFFGFSPFASRRTNRYMEALILEDAQLSVLGELRTNSGSLADSLDDQARAKLAEWKTDQGWLLQRFDANHDGKIDQAEWEQARAAARLEMQHEQLQRAPQERLNVIRKPTEGRPYLIAALPCAQLANREGRRAIGGLALTLVCLLAACYALAQLHG